MKQFVPFKEHNDWEGETWTFWLQVNGNARQLGDLADVIAESEDYEIDLQASISEAEVDLLVRHGDDGYYPDHNKVSGEADEFRGIDLDDGDPFYKGGIFKFFNEESR